MTPQGTCVIFRGKGGGDPRQWQPSVREKIKILELFSSNLVNLDVGVYIRIRTEYNAEFSEDPLYS